MTDLAAVKRSRLLRHPWVYIALASLILLAHEVFYFRDLGSDAVDDAYISFRYAQNLLNGEGLVFNPGERVEGYTNFLWTIILAAFMRLGLDPSAVSIVLGAAFSVGTLWLVYQFSRLACPAQPLIPLVASLALAVDGSFALWAVSGMETSMFAFLVVGALACHVWEWRQSKPGLLSGALLALASMTRPEGLLVFVVLLLHQVVARLLVRRELPGSAEIAKAGVFVGVYLPYYLWRYYYYGFLLPNTFYAKVTVHDVGAQYQRGLGYVATFGRLHLGWVLPLLASVPLIKRRFSFWLTSLVAVVVAYVSYIVYVGGDWSVGRFFVPILPLAYMLAAAGVVETWATLARWLGRLGRLGRPIATWRSFGLGLLAGGCVLLFQSSSLRGEHELFVTHFQAARATRARVAMGQWLSENVPPETYIAVDAAGQIPFHSRLRSLDMFGVNDVHTAHIQVEAMGSGVPGHEKFDFNYIMWRQPDLIIASAPFLEGSDTYGRLDVTWTEDPSLHSFLFVYRRKGWNGWS
jgi:arabinofuranosyltransferase